MAPRLEFWQKATLLLCLYGFFKEMKPSEPFLTPYLKAPPKNFTDKQLENEVYPVWTYSYLVALFLVFLFTDVLRYKPVIVVEGLAYLTTRVLLIWATSVRAMQFMQFAYGVATGAEVAYYSYIYAVVEAEHYLRVTGFTRAAVLAGRMMSGVVGQLLISLSVTDYLTLNYISMTSVCIALVITFILPSASGNVFGIVKPGENQSEVQVYGATNHSDDSSIATENAANCFLKCFSSWKLSLRLMWRDFKECYSKNELLKWSLWWAFGTCGEFMVENYVQNLWDDIYSARKHKKIYNGGVTALSNVFGASVALLLGYLKVNWSVFGELVLGVVSVADAFFLYISAHTSSIWLAYLMYILFRMAYTFLVTIASFQIAKNVGMDRYALVFGCNMFVALLLQTILTVIVVDERGLSLDIITQFVVYGSFFFILGAVFLGKAMYTMTRIGWRTCWNQRYVTDDRQELIEQSHGNDGDTESNTDHHGVSTDPGHESQNAVV
ncbi:thiamine transporter 2-like [Actinia tenebrosa]|uniref:Thiamine transporter 2-like n=1 Tax=Actinia tenebrosa TaxID=6105 RepID=A0A6P8IAP0_ACTTE|nr:thiamine transporter 2-like [Actinia tenebrosa]